MLGRGQHAPGGRPATRATVGLRVGSLTKTFEVVGDRAWQAGVTSIKASDPQVFTSKQISYDVAFGGVDQEHEDPKHHAAYMLNPVGRGFRKHLRAAWADGKPLPNTEEVGQPVTSPAGRYQPMSLGPLGRGWEPRSRFAGTYDQHWLDDVFPFLPKDFDERYYQAAPADQQIALPKASLEVAFGNLTPDGRRHFVLPFFDAPVNIFPRIGDREDFKANLDTIVFEPDQERFTMMWRVTRLLKRSMLRMLWYSAARARFLCRPRT